MVAEHAGVFVTCYIYCMLRAAAPAGAAFLWGFLSFFVLVFWLWPQSFRNVHIKFFNQTTKIIRYLLF